jgi:hypothetical protein
VGDVHSTGVYADITSSDCRTQSTGATTFVVDNSCSGILSILEETGSCFWVHGCSYEIFRTNAHMGSPLRDIHMVDGRIFRGNFFEANAKITTGIPDGDELSGYFGTMSWDDLKDGRCEVGYQFRIPRDKLSGAYILEAFKEKIPSLQDTLSGHSRRRGFFNYSGGRKIEGEKKARLELPSSASKDRVCTEGNCASTGFMSK